MFSSVWMYAWDLQDEGLENVLGFMRDAGVDAINMASAYHAGYFIHSHNPSHKMYFPEDGVVYFQPDGRFFQGTPLKPQVASVSAETDWFAAAGEQLDRYDLKLVAWTVCTHNTRLGMAHPAHVVRNAFGDPYYHALCPSSPDVRQYIRGLCRNLAARYPMYAVQLESPGFMGVEHGHHHERYGTVLRPLELWLISLCFCHACRRRAREHGLDMDAITAAVKAHLADYFESAPMPPQGRPRDREEMLGAVPQLAELESFRHGVETSLIREVRQDLRSLGETRLFVLEGYDADWAPYVDAFYVSAYHRRPDEAQRLVREQRERMGKGGDLHAGIRVGFNAVMGPGELGDLVQAVLEGGATGVNFYNYSEAPRRALEWIRPALMQVRKGRA